MSFETVPEIRRMNMEHVVLFFKTLGVRDVLSFDYFDPPSRDQLAQSLLQLFVLNAIDATGRITSMGTQVSALSFHLHKNDFHRVFVCRCLSYR